MRRASSTPGATSRCCASCRARRIRAGTTASRYLRDPDRDPIDTPGWQYADRESYRTNSYPRTAVALRSLEGLVGRERFLRGMRHFAETWRYRHPYPDDFFAAFAEGAGADLAWYFEAVFRGTGDGRLVGRRRAEARAA